MPSIDNMFCQQLLKQVLIDVREYEPGIKVNEAQTYIELPNKTGKERWFTFKFRDFYWENYVANIWDGKAQAWNRWLDIQKKYEGTE